ncbi:hypothetical protein F5Y15DRAFT_358136 [Xylariaceae sp. FL0016]|nr:hypothetical protein F5Y15DRAFT_358136 [Xylariaceae sp. FL0016]
MVPERRRIFRKISLPFLRTPLGASVTVVRRINSKSRPSLRSMEKATNEPLGPCAPEDVASYMINTNSISNGNSNTNSSGKSSGPTNSTGTTAKTSFESKKSSKDNHSGERRPASIVRRKEPETVGSTTPDSNLTTIQETEIDFVVPSILTVEKAAAAKIYLETYFNEKLSRPSQRSFRRQYLESELYHSPDLTPLEKNMRRRMFYQRETDHLRETRTLMAKTIGAVQGQHNKLAEGYEVIKILGKGSFGVVRLVREKATHNGTSTAGNAYAMKVIRKSAMLRTSQEGHLRAERDFLVASKGANW